MLFGVPMGGYMGGPAPFVPDHGEAAFHELPDLSRTNGAEIVLRVLGERWQAVDYAVQQLQSFLTWDFERTSGVWLDQIGRFLGVPRDTRSDVTYRKILAAYALCVYPRRRTTDGLLQGLGALVGDTAAVWFEPLYPKSFVVEIFGLATGEQSLWDAIRVVQLATPATYRAQVIATIDGALLADDSSGAVVFAEPQVVDDSSGTVVFADVGLMSWVF